jgi:3-methylcrotonyl-CoA carboxylase alpha subunit
MRLQCGTELYEIELRPASGEWEAVVNGERLRLAVAAAGDGRYEVRQAGAPATLHLARAGATFYLFWDGVAYQVEEPRPGSRRAPRSQQGALEAPMPGRVSAVKVAVGQRVAKGDELLVVEAMKMENALRAPRAGVVTAVRAALGEMVAPGTALVELADTEAEP